MKPSGELQRNSRGEKIISMTAKQGMPTGHPPRSPEDLALIRQSFGVMTVFSSWPNELLERLLPVSRLRRNVRGDLVHSETLHAPKILTVVSGHIMAGRWNSGDSCAPIAVLGTGFVCARSTTA